jgi:hypothetical protein
MGTPPGWGLEHRASNPLSVKNLTTIETSTIVKLLSPHVPVGMKRTSKLNKGHFIHDNLFLLQIERDISKRYKNRPVNIMGGVNVL